MRIKPTIQSFCLFALAAIALPSCTFENSGRPVAKKWHRYEMAFQGPETSENDAINPFLDYRLDVSFTGPSGQTYQVPGFYAADGNAAESSANQGNVWKVYFSPDEIGAWTYACSFVSGTNIAIEATDGRSAEYFDGKEGTFSVSYLKEDLGNKDFRNKGRLDYTGGHYFQFAESKEYFLKGGADSPENFLAYNEFDNTYDADAGSGSYSHIGGFIHSYDAHIQDWQKGDPTWQDGKGKGIIGALNYLSSKDMNSVYFLTYNVDGGDGRDVWMWTEEDERQRFDVSKLAQWEIVFSQMDKLGLMLHVVTQETENDHNLGGSPGLNLVRKLYYRELIARYAHHPALIWNLGEENNTPHEDRLAIASFIRSLDAYNHPITVHTHVNTALTFYKDLLGTPNFEATSIQSNMSNYHHEAVAMRRQSAEAGRKWAIFGDEQGAASHGVLPDADDATHDLPRKEGLWGNLMGGGAGVEWYFGHQYAHMDINCEDWRSRDIMWEQTKFALDFFHEYLPFWEMEPADALTASEDSYCFAKEGDVYAVYLKNGGTTKIDLSNSDGVYTIQWYNPRKGGELLRGTIEAIKGGDWRKIGLPPHEDKKDWLALIQKQD